MPKDVKKSWIIWPDQQYITQEQYDQVINDDIYSQIQAAQAQNSESADTIYSYFEDELIDQVINDLMNIKGYTRTQAQNLVYSGGLKIYTTQDQHIQSILDEEYANPENYPENVQYALDYALTVTNPQGEEVNYSKEMLSLYFQNEDRSSTFCLILRKKPRPMLTGTNSLFLQTEARLLQNV